MFWKYFWWLFFSSVSIFFSQKTFWHTRTVIMEKMVKKINVGKHAEQQELIQMVELNNISVILENFFDGLSWNQTSELTIQLLNIINRILDMSSTKIFYGVCGSNIYVSPTWTEDTVPIYVACWHAESFKLEEINMAQKQDSFCYPPVSGSLHSR